MPRNITKIPIKPGNWNIRGIEAEAFVAGVMAILLTLASVQAAFPASGLPTLGLIAFIAMSGLGALLLRSRFNKHPRKDLLLGLIAAFAIAWVAAGRLYISEI